MRKFMLAILMVLMVVSSSVYAAESVEQSMIGNGSYKIMQMVWVTDGSGDLTTTDTAYEINGIVMKADCIPSATAAPTDNYDITLRNTSGIDVFGDTGPAGTEGEDGGLANLDTAVAAQNMPIVNAVRTTVPVMGKLSLDVLNAGNSKGGTIRIHFITVN